MTDDGQRAQEIANLVVVEAVGSIATPFAPVPFVDDWLAERVFERVARKVLARSRVEDADRRAVALVEGYAEAGATGLRDRLAGGALRFVLRKIALVFDVKKGHDLFGETIVFALAVDVAIEGGLVDRYPPNALGGALYRARQGVGSAALASVTRAARSSFGSSPNTRWAAFLDATRHELGTTRARLRAALAVGPSR